jgi:membrane protein
MMRDLRAKFTPLGRVNVPSLPEWWALIKKTIAAWLGDYAPSMGAALSYYTVFSMAPTLLIVISVAGLVFGEDAVRGEIFGQLSYLMGPAAAATVQQMLVNLHQQSHGVAGTIIGVALVLAGATSVFGELQNALDRIWHASPKESSGLISLIRARLVSFGLILGIAFLLIVSLVLSAAISAVGHWWAGAFGRWELLAQTVNEMFGFVVTMASFAAIYRLIPRVSIHWTDVWLGASITALLFTLGRLVISIYIGHTAIASVFGAAGSLVVVFVWVYYSAQIFLLGAEFTRVYALNYGSLRGHDTDPAAGEDRASVPVRKTRVADFTRE